MSGFKISKTTAVEEVLNSESKTGIVGKKYMNDNLELCATRTYDGSANNLNHPSYGMVGTALIRKSPSAYGDGSSTLAARTPTPREISNAVCKETSKKPSSLNMTDMVWAWGQFLDHEIDLTPTLSDVTADMITPSGGDEVYPNRRISFERSKFVDGTDPREQVNAISSYIDATNLYGCCADRVYALRKLDGTGEMKTSVGDNSEILLPKNTFGLENAGSDATTFFVAGDVRANENVLLTGIHTLFVREHNRLCQEIKLENPEYEEEIIFQTARRYVKALMQNITFKEFLPALLGSNGISSYEGYDENVDASIATEFSTAGYRLGHSMLSSDLQIGSTDASASIHLRDAFFNPSWVQTNGVDLIIEGACKKLMQEIDNEVVDDIRDFLFGAPTAQQLLDLASLNIQRGRDHGLPDYNTVRESYGLPKYTTFSQITSNATLQSRLSSVYSTVDDIDPWVGGLCEDHLSGKAVGPLINAILKDQFERLRDGDRYWWENDILFDNKTKTTIKNTKLSDIIKRNTTITNINSDVFHL